MSTVARVAALTPGDVLPPRTVVPTLRQLVRYAGASRDLYAMHYDLDFARDLGHRELSVHGLLKAALLGRYLADVVPAGASVRALATRYRGMDFRDEPMVLGARVGDVADGVAHLALSVTSADGSTSTTGTAEVVLPTTSPRPPEEHP